MGSLLEKLYDVLFQPRTAMRRIADERPIWQAVGIVVMSVVIPLWAIYLGLKTAEFEKISGLIMLLQVVGIVFFWLIGTAIWHFFAELAGGRGTAVGLFAALGFAHFPRILIVPLGVFSAMLPNKMGPVFMAVFTTVLAVWSFYLNIVAISSTHDISRTKAIAVVLAPIFVLILAGVLLITAVGASVLQAPFWL